MKKLITISIITLLTIAIAVGQNAITHYQYWFDNATPPQPVSVNGSIYTFNQAVNTSGLSQGLHTCNIRFKDAAGLWSAVVSQYFYKSPLDNLPNKINAYRYWFDTNPNPTTVTVTPQNPENLTANINCTSLSQGTHNFHVQFRDINGLWSAVTNDVFTVGQIIPATVHVTSPNGGETWEYLSTHVITANFTPGAGVVVIELSRDGGSTWEFIGGAPSNTGTLSFNWNIYQSQSTQCKIRVNCSYDDGTLVIDESDNNFTISAPAGGMPFFLNPDGVSHLYWPFENSNWNDDKYSLDRHTWIRIGEEYSFNSCPCTQPCTPCLPPGPDHDCDYGCANHKSGDYYAQDWNNYSTFNGDCDQPFLSPMDGSVIVADYDNNYPFCYNLGNGLLQNADANNVFIIKNNFIFGILHIKNNHLTSVGPITHGSPIGIIGATFTGGKPSHAHCVLWKNVNSLYANHQSQLTNFDITAKEFLDGSNSLDPIPQDGLTYANRPFPRDDEFAAEFVFDANPNLAPFQQSYPPQQLIVNHASTICPGDSITLTSPTPSTHYFWSNGDTTQSITVDTSGTYSVYMVDSGGNGTMSQGFTVTLNTYEVQIAASNQSICGSSPVVLYPSLLFYSSGIGVSKDNFNHYLWSTGDTLSNITITNPGIYSLTFTDGYGCRTSYDSITITNAIPPTNPIITVNGTQLTCSNSPNCIYQWLVNGYPLPNATSQTYVADSTGSNFYYSVMVTNPSGCSAVSDSVLITTGIQTLSDFSVFQLYPNPNNGTFTVHFLSQTAKHAQIICTNLLGEKIYEREFSLINNELKAEIGLPALAKGLYLMSLTFNGKSYYRKVTITE